MKTLQLIWTFPDKFKEHAVIPGSFRTEMNFIGMLTNHKVQGSEYEGFTKNVLNGKAFPKDLFSLKALNEALAGLL